MKKMFVIGALFVILLASRVQADFSLCDYFEGEYTYYTESKVDDRSVNLGFCYMNEGGTKVNNVVAESMRIDNFEPGAAIRTLRARVIRTEYLDSGASVIYAYTDLINKNVIVFDEKINLQIACYDDYSIIGWPLILGSF